jgi:hypothetical protein
VIYRCANILKRDASIEKALYNLKNKDVAEAIEAGRARSMCSTNRRFYQTGTSPVIELAICDASCSAGGSAAIADLKFLLCHERGLAFGRSPRGCGNWIRVGRGGLRLWERHAPNL